MRSLLEYGTTRFEDAGISFGHGTTNALDEAAWLVLAALGLPPQELEPHLDKPVTEGDWKKTRALLERRVRTRKPAAYLLNEAWLGPHKFYVDERVIVPRSFIAELLLNVSRPREDVSPRGNRGRDTPLSILDLCTGSGCLAILAALKWPQARVDAADLSADALEVAKRNVADYRLAKRVRLVRSDLFQGLGDMRYDLIISNPPYVKASSMRRLPDEYRKEPELALASGRDGLDHTRTILSGAKARLQPGATLMVEIGHNRKVLEKSFPSLPFRWPRTSSGTGFVFTLTREELP
ncbi:MAG: 50S ribosomal protein L3 N(5)-glutamine methyltransferase [Usitatibacter sp.]